MTVTLSFPTSNIIPLLVNLKEVTIPLTPIHGPFPGNQVLNEYPTTLHTVAFELTDYSNNPLFDPSGWSVLEGFLSRRPNISCIRFCPKTKDDLEHPDPQRSRPLPSNLPKKITSVEGLFWMFRDILPPMQPLKVRFWDMGESGSTAANAPEGFMRTFANVRVLSYCCWTLDPRWRYSEFLQAFPSLQNLEVLELKFSSHVDVSSCYLSSQVTQQLCSISSLLSSCGWLFTSIHAVVCVTLLSLLAPKCREPRWRSCSDILMLPS